MPTPTNGTTSLAIHSSRYVIASHRKWLPKMDAKQVLDLEKAKYQERGPPMSAFFRIMVSKILQSLDWLENQDFDWYKDNIPFLETPDKEIDATYYYRWELVTRHICYGSPASGYSLTEFANRPFWSGAYGAIACPSGHQFNEIRWMHNPRVARDYLRYWFRTKGAQPRKYSSWLADSAWAVHQVHPNKAFIIDLFPDLVKNFKGWEARHWVKEMNMFWQTGHDDGMEFNINSRQTKDILRGDRAFRPSFNSYMWADATALARISALDGDKELEKEYLAIAANLKKQIQEKLWDPKRNFFFPMSSRDETDKEGNVVEAHTLTYQSGKFAGSPHGRWGSQRLSCFIMAKKPKALSLLEK